MARMPKARTFITSSCSTNSERTTPTSRLGQTAITGMMQGQVRLQNSVSSMSTDKNAAAPRRVPGTVLPLPMKGEATLCQECGLSFAIIAYGVLPKNPGALSECPYQNSSK